MNTFTYEYPVKVYFGEGVAKQHLKAELSKIGKTVMLAYGGGSIRENGRTGTDRVYQRSPRRIF